MILGNKFDTTEWLKSLGLSNWLQIATNGLEASATQRIAEEIGAHYREAVSAHMAEGEAEEAARSNALAELGDPQSAARHFRKSHLTEAEAKKLRNIDIEHTYVPCLIPLAASGHFFPLIFWWAFLSWVGFGLIPRLVRARRLITNPIQKDIAVCCGVTTVIFAIGYVIVLYQLHQNTFLGFYLFYCAYNPWFRIWNKLRHKSDGPSEIPPTAV